MAKARLHEIYTQDIAPALLKELQLKNAMQVPKLRKIVLNIGSKEAVGDSKSLNQIVESLASISGQRPVKTFARKSIAGFKLREGMAIGAKVTLRGKQMYEFLDRLINIALPKVRDFQGVPLKFDRGGNYNLGIKEMSIFPEVDFEVGDKVPGLNVTIDTTSTNAGHSRVLLEKFGMPFKKNS